ncbi:hypothetical protein [Streptomyces sp. NPDC020597]|uniref:COG1470 family protein n=1 Tax=unclassified Streptomyces TaxID=2593676 RepID=UPI0037A331B6
MTATARLDPPSLPVEPGGTHQVTLHVRNGGDIVEAYRFEVVGVPSAWAAVEPAELSLYPGTADTVTLTLRPPRTPDTAVGPTPFAVRVLPVERPQDVTVPEGTVEVLPFHEIASELLPRSNRGRLRARFQVAVHNHGNTPADVTLGAWDTDEKLRYRVHPAEAELAPGEQGHLRLTVRPRHRILRGAVQRHAFQVRVALAGLPGDPLDGAYEQRPLVPAMLPKALALAAASGVALTAAWFGVLEPTIKSTAGAAVSAQASQAVQSAVKEQQKKVDAVASAAASQSAAAAQAGGGGAGAGAGAQPAAQPSPGASGIAAAAGPGAAGANFYTPLSVRAQNGDSADATFTVPKGKTFLISDIVLQNPQGDYGTLTLDIDGSQVSLLALEDFRDTDSPWVTPLRVPAGGKVTMTVACRTPGSPPSAPKPTTCAESALLNGKMVAS